MHGQVPPVRKRRRRSPAEGMEEGASNMVWHFSGLLSPDDTSLSLGLASALCGNLHCAGEVMRIARWEVLSDIMFSKKKTKQNSEIFLKEKGPWGQHESMALCSEWGVEPWIINSEVCIIMELKNGQSLQSTNYDNFHLPLLPFEFTFTRQLYPLQRKHYALLEYSGGTSCETSPRFSATAKKAALPLETALGFCFTSFSPAFTLHVNYCNLIPHIIFHLAGINVFDVLST